MKSGKLIWLKGCARRMEMKQEDVAALQGLVERLYASSCTRAAFARGANAQLRMQEMSLTRAARNLFARPDIMPLYLEQLFWSLQHEPSLPQKVIDRLPEPGERENAIQAVFAGLDHAFGESFTVEERQALSRLARALTGATSP